MSTRLILVAAAAGFGGALLAAGLLGDPLGRVHADGDEGVAGQGLDRIGFVDVKRVFEQCRKTVDRERAINQQYVATKEDLQNRKKELQDEQDGLALYGPESTQRRQGERAIALKAFKIQFEDEWLKEKVKNDLKIATEQIYVEIMALIGRYAEEHGYRAVFKVDEEEIQSFTRDELKLKIHTRTVLYHMKADDLTEALIQYVNDPPPKKGG